LVRRDEGRRPDRSADRPIGASYQSVHLGAEHFAQQGDLAADDVVINQVP
jgi:hypothetical protein